MRLKNVFLLRSVRLAIPKQPVRQRMEGGWKASKLQIGMSGCPFAKLIINRRILLPFPTSFLTANTTRTALIMVTTDAPLL